MFISAGICFDVVVVVVVFVIFLQPNNGGVVMVNFYNGFVSCNKSISTLDQVVGRLATSNISCFIVKLKISP